MNKKVLLVDDSSFMRTVLRDILTNDTSHKIKVLEADGEKQALSLMKKESPNLVLLDIIMNSSEVEGIKILKAIQLNYPKTPVIMITSIGHQSIKDQCEALGAKGYIQKPFNAEDIQAEISKYL